MFQLNNSQVAALRQASVHDFVERVVSHLYDCVPDTLDNIEPAELRKFIHHAIDEAAGYGIVTERDVCLYIVLLLTFGTFDRFPSALTILSGPEPAVGKLEALCDELSVTAERERAQERPT